MIRIRKYGDPALREKARRIEKVDDEVRSLADEMIEAMHADNGIGLAAEQIGRTESICVVDIPVEMDLDEDKKRINPGVNMPLVMINPQITNGSPEEDVGEEGCLSFPGIYLPISRSRSIDIRYMDRNGDHNEITVMGMLARCVQHETDHLDGILITDRAPKLKKVSVSGRLKRMKKETQSELAKSV